MIRKTLARRPGITLIEVLVLFAIILFLLGLILPILFRFRQVADRSVSANNLRQLALAMHNCHDTYGKFPPVVGSFPAKDQGQGTVHFYLLPFIEQDNVFRQAQGSVTRNKTYSMRIPVFLHPKDASAPPNNQYKEWLATTNYAANWMVLKDTGAQLAQILDGTSNTLMFAERYQMCNDSPCAWGYSQMYYWAPMFAYYSHGKFQMRPSQKECDPALAQAIDPGGITVAMCDGSSRTFTDNLSPRTWHLLCDPADGQVIPNDF